MRPDRAQVHLTAVTALSNPWVWGPLPDIARPHVEHVNQHLSRCEHARSSILGSDDNAIRWSNRLRSASVGVDIAALLLAPSRPFGTKRLEDKAKSSLVNLVAATTAMKSKTLIRRTVRCERQNGATDRMRP